MTQKKNKVLSGVYVALLMLFLYLPILVLIVFSFNSSKGYSWTGFSFKWYVDLFSNELILNSLKNTLVVALFEVVAAGQHVSENARKIAPLRVGTVQFPFHHRHLPPILCE